MPARADTRDYRALFLSDAPLLDSRSPVEFAKGAFPCSVNLPLMSDEERHQVGICYKQHGQEAAIDLGHKLVAGNIRQQRIQQWRDFAEQHQKGYLYCFRGGLRSQTVQQWLTEAGVDYPLIHGGYKAMRQFLIKELENSLQKAPPVLISGSTGTGKTRVIEQLDNSVDLEALANHRGSTFGHLLTPQPAQISFENALSVALLKLTAAGCTRVYAEDEGRMIGSLSLPDTLRRAMQDAPMLVIEEPIESRAQVILEDYIIDLGERFQKHYGDNAADEHCASLQRSLARVQKRLGGQRFQSISADLDTGFEQQRTTGSLDGHRHWITRLLSEYYDPMYDYQMSRRDGVVLARGDRTSILAYAKDHHAAD